MAIAIESVYKANK